LRDLSLTPLKEFKKKLKYLKRVIFRNFVTDLKIRTFFKQKISKKE
jgi:hypothetical protein